MNKKNIIAVLFAVLFFFVTYNSQAVTITHLSGELMAGVWTNYSTGEESWGSDEVITDPLLFPGGFGGYGYARENLNLNGDSLNILSTTTAQSINGTTGVMAFETGATVKSSGTDPDSMLKFKLESDNAGEVVGQSGVTLSAETFLAGSLNSGGGYYLRFPPYNFTSLLFQCGVSQVDYVFSIYYAESDLSIVPYLTFELHESIENESADQSQTELISTLEMTYWEVPNKDEILTVGDTFYVYMEQTALATVYPDRFCSASTFLTETGNVSVSITADVNSTQPVPEPASFLLLGLSLLGFGLIDKIKKIFPKKVV